MNIILEPNQFDIKNIFLLEKKNNIIIHGSFTKILYSNHLFSTNGLLFLFPIENDKIETILYRRRFDTTVQGGGSSNTNNMSFEYSNGLNKHIVHYHPYTNQNLFTIKQIAKIEYDVIEFYKKMTGCNKKISNILSKQMYSGNLKIYRDYTRPVPTTPENESAPVTSIQTTYYIIKISGIWETEDEVGITYKLQRTYSPILKSNSKEIG
jgi:hypothetical protein